MNSGKFVLSTGLILIAVLGVIILLTVYESAASAVSQQIENEQKGLVRIATNLLKAEGGDFTLRDGQLFAGDTPIPGNNTLADEVASISGGEVSLYQVEGEDVVRVATTRLAASNQRATGGRLNPEAEDALFRRSSNEPFTTRESVDGDETITRYDFLKSPEGEILGVIQISTPTEPYDRQLEEIYNRSFLVTGIALLVIAGFVFIALSSLSRRLRREAGRSAALLQSTREGVFGLDLDGKGTFLNAAGGRYLGYSESETLGEDMDSLVRKPRESVSGADRKTLVELASSEDQVANEDEFKAKDGTVFPVGFFVSPVRENEETTGYVVTFTNLTDAKEAEARVAAMTERLETIIQSAEKEHLPSKGDS
ncbi:MAG: cache domain-containing protein [Verrucomicrobiota bacterium]